MVRVYPEAGRSPTEAGERFREHLVRWPVDVDDHSVIGLLQGRKLSVEQVGSGEMPFAGIQACPQHVLVATQEDEPHVLDAYWSGDVEMIR